MIRMDSPFEINTFLESCRIPKGSKEYTHIRMGDKAGVFNITDKDRLYELYNKAVFDYDIDMSLLEKQPDICCIIGDVDLKHPVSLNPVRKYTMEKHVFTIIKIYQDIFRKLFNIAEENLDAFIFERAAPYLGKGAVKDGFHFMFLGVVADKQTKMLIHTLAAQEVAKAKLMDDLNIKNPDDVIDTAIVRNNWLMYGSCKPKLQPYKATQIINAEGQLLDVDTDDEPVLVRMFSLDKEWELTPTADDINIDTLLKEHRKSRRGAKKGSKKNNKNKKHVPLFFEEVTALVGLFSQSRADDYNSWLEVGMCLHNIDKCYLPLWEEFSKKSSKYEKGVCETNWDGFKNGYWSIGSLHWWGKEDSPKEYAEFMIKQTDPMVMESIKNDISGTSYDVAKVVHQRFRWEFVCASIQYNQWYYFDDIRWNPLDKGVVLRESLSNAIFKQYCRVSSYLMDLAAETPNTDDKEKPNGPLDKAKKCTSLAKKLRTRKFKLDVMADCADLFLDDKFLDNIDEHHYLLGFNDGVLDLETLTPRKARPSDFITKSTRMHMPLNDNCVEDADIKLIEKVIEQILPDPEVREYFMMWAASCLDGHAQQMFMICTGNGSNGKSLLLGFLKDTLGEYSCTFPVSLITNKRAQSNSATPEIARTRGCRLGICQEPESNAVLNGGLIKELTGKDEILSRELYKAPVAIKPQLQIVMMCNDLPKVNDTDGGIWRRIVVVPFDSKFTDDPELLKRQNHFPRDDHLDENLSKCRPAFIVLLMRYYKKYKNNGRKLNAPDKVKVQTNKYKCSSDVYAEFLTERLEEDQKEVMGITQIFTMFRQWYREINNDNKCPNRGELKTYIDKYYPQLKKKNGWRFRIKLDIDDDDDDDEPSQAKDPPPSALADDQAKKVDHKKKVNRLKNGTI